jgi:hypothetical protein
MGDMMDRDMESGHEPVAGRNEKPKSPKKRWTTPELTAYGKVPDENATRAALGYA